MGDGGGLNSVDQPMTPCPSAVEYVTPVFAKNYQVQSTEWDRCIRYLQSEEHTITVVQGVWRYVVQIPYEGYFTQTVEVVKCLSTKCQFLQVSCGWWRAVT